MAGSFVEADPWVPRSSCHQGGSIRLLSKLENLIALELERQVEAERVEWMDNGSEERIQVH
jgi:hypothetical protein